MVTARLALASVFLCLSVSAGAETLTVAGSDPAAANTNDLLSIAVNRFEGEDGGVLAQALEDELGAATMLDEPYFRIVAPESHAPFDALLTGSVRADVDEASVTEKRKRCVEYGVVDKKKCKEEVDVDIRCRRRVTTLTTTARLVAMADGAIRYTRPQNARDDTTYCPDREASRTVGEFLADAQRAQIVAIRRDLAPRTYVRDVRVDENRKGLPKPAQDAFKAAVRQTKTDPAGACAAWTALTRDVIPTAALAFNLGLCAEREGKYDVAVNWYSEASGQGSRNGDISEGLERIDRTRRALVDWAARKELKGE